MEGRWRPDSLAVWPRVGRQREGPAGFSEPPTAAAFVESLKMECAAVKHEQFRVKCCRGSSSECFVILVAPEFDCL